MKNNSYLESITNQSLPVSSFYACFNDYKIIEIDKKKYIVGIDVPIIKDSSSKKIRSYDDDNLVKTVYISPFDNYNLFFDLYNMVNKSKENYKSWSDKNLQKMIPDKEILRWIKKYGLPYNENRSYHLVKKEGFVSGIDLNIFKRRILDLYFSYELWEASLFDEERFEKIEGDKETTKNIIYNKMLKYPISSVAIIPEYKGNDNFELIIKAGDLYSAACFEFYCLLTKDRKKEIEGELEEGESNFKVCSYCGKKFWTKETKAEYCPAKDSGMQSSCRKNAGQHRKKKAKKLWEQGYLEEEVYNKLNEKSKLKSIKKWFKEWNEFKNEAKQQYEKGFSIDKIYHGVDKNKIQKSDIKYWFKEWNNK